MTTQQPKRPIGRPPSRPAGEKRRFLQVERNRDFDRTLSMVCEIIARRRGGHVEDIGQSEAVRIAIAHYALTEWSK